MRFATRLHLEKRVMLNLRRNAISLEMREKKTYQRNLSKKKMSIESKQISLHQDRRH